MKRDYYSDSFFQSTRTDQNSSSKFYQILWCQIAPFGLANWTKKGFLFSRVAYHTGREQTVPLYFFRHCEIFFENKKFPLQFFMFCDRKYVKKTPKDPPFKFFWHCEFFSENKNFSSFNVLMFCDRMDVERHQRVPPSVSLIFYNRVNVEKSQRAPF